MSAQRRFIGYSVIYWLLFAVMAYVLVTLRFAHDVRPMIVIYDLMEISEQMPWGLRTLLVTVSYWWAYMLFALIMYVGVCSKLRRHSWRMHLSTTTCMLLLAGAWGYALYWLEYVLPTIK